MKKKFAILLSGLMLLGLVGCGESKAYEPKLAEMGVVNADDKYTNQYGVRDNLNVQEVKKDGDSIQVKTQSPTENVVHAGKNHMAVSTIDEKGKEYFDLSIKVTDNGGNALIIIKGNDIDKGKYLKIMPYKNKDGEFALYEIK